MFNWWEKNQFACANDKMKKPRAKRDSVLYKQVNETHIRICFNKVINKDLHMISNQIELYNLFIQQRKFFLSFFQVWKKPFDLYYLCRVHSRLVFFVLDACVTFARAFISKSNECRQLYNKFSLKDHFTTSKQQHCQIKGSGSGSSRFLDVFVKVKDIVQFPLTHHHPWIMMCESWAFNILTSIIDIKMRFLVSKIIQNEYCCCCFL